MTKKEAKKRIEKLKETIRYHRYLYHVLDKQEISEAALDSLKKELFDLEQKFPEFITPDSPTQRVGGKPLKRFKKIRHRQPMLSFNDAFSESDMKDWIERLSRILTKEELSYLNFFCELKFDGLAIELVYKDNILEVGATRGDGKIGEDITQNIKTIESIPLKINSSKKQGGEIRSPIVVRGEAFIPKDEFKKLNAERKKNGLPEYANPRNVAAGSLRQLNPKITASRHLDFFAYDIVFGLNEETHQQKHQALRDLGFKVDKHSRFCRNLEEVFSFHNYCQKIREKLPYEVDGIVVIVNNNSIFEKLGAVGKSPRGAIAYKFPLKQSETIVENIRIQVGRTGALTPVAFLRPVSVGGTLISRATLHNKDEIRRLGLKIGDTVIVGRAGDVIPRIIKVLPEMRTGREKEFEMPKYCPVCGTKIKKEAGGVIYYCPNKNCPARQQRNINHFVSRGAFNIGGLGPKIISQLIKNGLIVDPADIFSLKKGDLLPLERFAEKSANNLIKEIESKKEVGLSKFIYSLGIRNVGEETADCLAKRFGSLSRLKKASLEELEKINDIGPVVGRSVFNWFRQEKNLALLEKFKRNGLIIKMARDNNRLSQGLSGKIFVFTGSLKKMARGEAKEIVKSLGGKANNSLSKKTDYLVVGKDPGSKLKKAEKLGVKTITEEEFLKMVKINKK